MGKIKNILNEAVPGVDFVNCANLVSGGYIDSLQIVAIIVALSDEYGFEFPFEEMKTENFESIETIETMVSRISNQLS